MTVRNCLAIAIVACLSLFAFNSLTRIRAFSPDSMNYVDVARNIAGGRGIVQSTLGFNQPHFGADAAIPSPLTSQPPAYPLAVAALGRLGLRFTDAALLIAALGFGLSIAAAFLLARDAFDESVGLLSAALLLHYYPIGRVSSVAWSESLGVAFVLGALWLIGLQRARPAARTEIWLAGGVCGLAFLTRYSLWPILVVALAGAVDFRNRRETVRRMGMVLAGFAVTAGWLIARNVVISGSPLGPSPNPSGTSLLINARDAFNSLFDCYGANHLPPSAWPLAIRQAVAAGILLALIGWGTVRGRRSSVVAVFFGPASGFITMWVALHLCALVAARSRVWFDPIDFRLTVPAGVCLVVLVAALLVRATALRSRTVHVMVAALVLLALGRQARFLAVSPVLKPDAIGWTRRLAWISRQTTERDLIVGDYTVDVPFYFPGRDAVAFQNYPYGDHPDYVALIAFLNRNCGRYDRFFLVLSHGFGSDRQVWIEAYGEFLADVVTGRLENYPAITPAAQITGAVAFRIRPPACAR